MKRGSTETLTAADCARRTGLTVRALRVYERQKLLEPARSAKGWRLYGPEELLRLNTIVALKNFGLSLAQIRKLCGASPPELGQILDMQLKVWAARRLAADRVIEQIHGAITRMRSRASLSVDELCELLRNTEMSNLQAITRELINQHITPEQERDWLTYWAQRPADAATGQALQAAARPMMEGFLRLMRGGLSPDSPEVQELVVRTSQHWLKSGMRERQLEQLAWNADVTRAWFALGGKLLARSVVPDDPEEAERLRQYINAARGASAPARAFRELVAEAGRLRATGASVSSVEARRIAKQYTEVCREHDLGDPSVHARWIAAFADFDDATRADYEYLAQVVSS
ncbi:MAG TPA: MerR family transcriptional regulator [Steroidobacteraceae bacterium]|jgi:DNA-binding transcriptional MerR regulator|nr:MerR family transcriptional regulator [Steroidobacteraceae bacterium]